MRLSSESLDGGLVIRVEEERIDAAVAIQFKEAMREAVAKPGKPVVLDMSRVTFLDSSGLGALVAVLKLLGKERPLELSGLTPLVDKVLRLTRMDTVFTIHPAPPNVGSSHLAR